MKIYVYGPGLHRYKEPLEGMYQRALEALGHEVATDPEDFGGADMSIVVKAHPDPTVLPRPRVLIFSDVTTRFQDIYRAMEPHFDLIFLVHNEPLVDNRRVFFLPVAHDPAIHRPVPGYKGNKAVFIGTCHPGREFIRDLPVRVWGNGWDRVGLDTHPVYLDEKCRIYTGAKVALNIHNPGETVNMRVFEVLACHGALLLSDNVSGLESVGLEPYVHFVPLPDKWIDTQIAHWLSKENEEKRQKIVEAGYKWVQNHTYQHRMEELLFQAKHSLPEETKARIRRRAVRRAVPEKSKQTGGSTGNSSPPFRTEEDAIEWLTGQMPHLKKPDENGVCCPVCGEPWKCNVPGALFFAQLHLLQNHPQVWKVMQDFDLWGLFSSCPECGKQGRVSVKQYRGEEMITCPYCGHNYRRCDT